MADENNQGAEVQDGPVQENQNAAPAEGQAAEGQPTEGRRERGPRGGGGPSLSGRLSASRVSLTSPGRLTSRVFSNIFLNWGQAPPSRGKTVCVPGGTQPIQDICFGGKT